MMRVFPFFLLPGSEHRKKRQKWMIHSYPNERGIWHPRKYWKQLPNNGAHLMVFGPRYRSNTLLVTEKHLRPSKLTCASSKSAERFGAGRWSIRASIVGPPWSYSFFRMVKWPSGLVASDLGALNVFRPTSAATN